MHVIAVAALLFALAPEHIAQVKAYAGHHSWDKVAGAESFWDTALVKDALRVQLRAREKRMVDGLWTAGAVEQDGPFLFSNRCKPHCCPCEFAVVVVNIETGVVYIALRNRKAQWITPSGRSRQAPEDVRCAILRAFGDWAPGDDDKRQCSFRGIQEILKHAAAPKAP